MLFCRGWLILGAAFLSLGCAGVGQSPPWHAAVERQAGQLGYRNWIVIAEASFPAHNRPGTRQVSASVGVPEALDHVLNTLEQTENVRPHIFLTRELRSVENDFAPGIDELRKKIQGALHGHEATELEQQSLPPRQQGLIQPGAHRCGRCAAAAPARASTWRGPQ